MRLIENIDTYYFDYRNGQTSLYLPKDRAYAGKVISGLTFFAPGYGVNAAPDGTTVENFARRAALNLYDEDSRCVVGDTMLDNFFPGTVKPVINRRLNYDISEIRILSAFNSSSVPCCVEFRSEGRAPRPIPQPVNSLTVAIPKSMFNSRNFLLLSDLNLSALYGKRIWKISALSTYVRGSSSIRYYWNAALTIREQEGRIFNQVPLAYFKPYDIGYPAILGQFPDDLYLDGYIPDYYNSYIEINPVLNSGSQPTGPLYLTFFY